MVGNQEVLLEGFEYVNAFISEISNTLKIFNLLLGATLMYRNTDVSHLFNL